VITSRRRLKPLWQDLPLARGAADSTNAQGRGRGCPAPDSHPSRGRRGATCDWAQRRPQPNPATRCSLGCKRARRHPSVRRSQGTTNGSAVWPDALRPVHRQDVGVSELPVEGSSRTVAVATRQEEQRARFRAGRSLQAKGGVHRRLSPARSLHAIAQATTSTCVPSRPQGLPRSCLRTRVHSGEPLRASADRPFRASDGRLVRRLQSGERSSDPTTRCSMSESASQANRWRWRAGALPHFGEAGRRGARGRTAASRQPL
jgi:hypothetical protein